MHVVVETMRGHNLGRLIYQGHALPNTGVPGNIKGYSKERVIHSPCAGVCHNVKKITDIVEKEKLLRISIKHQCMRACQAYLED